MSSEKIFSPCIKICTLNDDKMCIGCGRYEDEIRRWRTSMTPEERNAIINKLSQRLKNLGSRI